MVTTKVTMIAVTIGTTTNIPGITAANTMSVAASVSAHLSESLGDKMRHRVRLTRRRQPLEMRSPAPAPITEALRER